MSIQEKDNIQIQARALINARGKAGALETMGNVLLKTSRRSRMFGQNKLARELKVEGRELLAEAEERRKNGDVRRKDPNN